VIATTVPYTFVDNRVVIECKIDGKGPYAFVLDTGSSTTVIAPGVARALALRTAPAGQTTGAGNGSAAMSSTSLARLDIGDFSFANVATAVLDLSEIKNNIGFERFDGVIGYPTLAHLYTKIDADRHTVTFSHAPIAVPPTATNVPFTFDTNFLVRIPATIGGIAGTVIVDTGDRSSLTLFRPFARRNHFYDTSPSLANVLTGFGIGGPVYGDVFRLPSFEVLGANLSYTVTRASRQAAGLFATGTESGSIGGGVLRHFDIVYDYPHRVMRAWPSSVAGTRDPYDRSGMWLSREGSSVVVRYVAKGGPADSGGVVAGVTVVAMNGRPVVDDDITGMRRYLATSPPGTHVRLRTSRGGAMATRTIVLRELL
jgi:hypothetical protein